ncbi:hypothetical protein EDB19DRAFT_1912851 [Suillus lakei]|nr:hypothetical protein EDB19DRAFT_1912851 [Suillus lakei]
MNLWIPEVVRIIFEYVYDPNRTAEDREGRATVAGLAITCRAFKDPALDVLWAQLHSLNALVLCSGGKRDDENQLIWDRPLYDADWRILARYGRRVHSLTVPRQSETLHISTMQVLSCFPLPGPLLPNLRVLSWLSNCEDSFPFLHCFCGPNLTTLRLSRSSWGIRKCVAVASLAPSCPLLKEFSCGIAEDASRQAISEAIVGWNKLQSLQVGPLDEQALTHAASLQTLQELHFSVADLKRPVLKFCCPRSVKISVPSPSFLHAFFRKAHLSTQRLHLRCQDHDEKEIHEHFFSHLQACFMHPEELLELKLTFATTMDDQASFELVLVNNLVLQPLLSFKGLNCLDLGKICTACVDNTFLTEMALSCPHLRELYLGDRGYWPVAPLPTFDGIAALLTHCRQLSDLGIFFDATLTSRIINMPEVDAVNLNITTFSVGTSPISDPMKVAAVLSFLIPNANICHCILDSPSRQLQKRKEQWETVNVSLETFVSVRKHSWEQGWSKGKAVVEENAM